MTIQEANGKGRGVMDISVREACRRRMSIGGVDAQALEGALQQTENELTALKAERDGYKVALEEIKKTWLSNKDCAVMFNIARKAVEVK